MKGLDTGKDKVKKICDVLRKETLEPAKREAEETLSRAQAEAAAIIEAAEKEAARIYEETRREIEKQHTIFQASLAQACRQTLELLKQEIEEKLFNRELSALLGKQLQEPKVLHQLIDAVVGALGKEGTDADLSIYIPAAVPARTINDLLAGSVLEKLKEKSVLLSGIAGGIEVKLHNKRLTIDISEATIREIVANYIRKDFRDLLFGKN
jgi:V/A-type H+-transporting ATPase subunit E